MALQIRQLTKDTNAIEYTTAELMNYINTAIKLVSTYLIGNKDPEMIVDITISDGTSVPSNFMSFVGIYPVYISGSVFKLYNTASPVSARYFATKADITDMANTIPFKDALLPIVTRLAAMQALNRNEFDITQDTKILDELMSSYKAAM